MMFMGAMMLIVLPLFLFVCAQMVKQGEHGHSFGAKVFEAICYAFAAFCLFGLVLLIVEMLN
jgi:hypothetical protein